MRWLKPEPLLLSYFTNMFCTFLITGMDDEENDLCPLQDMLDDKLRVSYYKKYLAEVAKAIRSAWSFNMFLCFFFLWWLRWFTRVLNYAFLTWGFCNISRSDPKIHTLSRNINYILYQHTKIVSQWYILYFYFDVLVIYFINDTKMVCQPYPLYLVKNGTWVILNISIIYFSI